MVEPGIFGIGGIWWNYSVFTNQCELRLAYFVSESNLKSRPNWIREGSRSNDPLLDRADPVWNAGELSPTQVCIFS